MKKAFFQFLFCLFTYFLSINSCAQGLLSSKVVDSDSGISIPFAYIRISGEKMFIMSDEDGYFNLSVSSDDTLEISHVAYKSLRVPLKGIKGNYVFRLEELPVSINPIVVTADWAENQLEKAVKLTYKEIKAPIYLKYYREDQIIFNDTKVRGSMSESDVQIKMILSPSHGATYNIYRRNIKNICNDSINMETPEYIIKSDIPINNFLIGVSAKDDNKLYFYSQEVNDSVMIISYKPRKGLESLKDRTVTRGRFFIDRISGRFFRIDCEVDQEMWAHQRELAAMTDTSSRFYYAYSFSMKLDENSYPSEVDIEYSFSYGKDDPGSMWQNRCQMRFIPLKEKPDLSDKSKLVPRDSLFINMTSSFDDKFSQKIKEIFK